MKMTTTAKDGGMDFDILSSDDEQLQDLLSVTPPPELENGDLFQELADLIENEDQPGKQSPIYEYLSDSDNSAVDIEKVNDVVLDIKGSTGEEELVNYLTNPHKRQQNQSVNPQKIVTQTTDPQKNRFQVIKIVENKSIVNKPITRSGVNHGMVRVGNSNVKVLKAVKMVKPSNQGQMNSYVPCNRMSSPTDSVTSSTSVGKCKSKSAIAAKENREKKKKYISTLESSVKGLASENKTLKSQVGQLDDEVEKLRLEVDYLKSVLANQSTLSRLLDNIPGVTSVSLRSNEDSCCQVKGKKSKKRERSQDFEGSESVTNSSKTKKRKLSDHDYANNGVVSHSVSDSRQLAGSTPALGGGVCLHVADEEVSLEFCAECSRRATRTKCKVH